MEKSKPIKKLADGKILVTGDGGYIGVVIAEELIEKGYAVKLLDRVYRNQHLNMLELTDLLG